MKTFACLALSLLLLACGGVEETAKTETETETPKTTQEQYFRLPGDFAGSHILVAYADAQNADQQITRTKEEALEKANQLLARIQAEPETFEDIAKMESDGPSKTLGGSLGSWKKGAMVTEFDNAVSGLTEGEVAPEPVETPFGYHLIRRDTMVVKHYGAEGFIIAFKGQGTPPTVARTREEAKQVSDDLTGKVTAANFDEMALQYNDLGDGAMFLGAFKEKDRIPPNFLEAITSLDFNSVTGPVETPMGFAFIRRIPLEQYAGAHVLIAYQGANQAQPDVTRSKEEAYALALELLAKAQAEPDQFGALAEEHSNGPTGPQGGDLGTWFKGLMLPQIDEAIAKLDVDAIGLEPIETPFGYHILKRNATPSYGPPAE